MRWRSAVALAACLGLLPLFATRADDKPKPAPDPKAAVKAVKVEVPP